MTPKDSETQATEERGRCSCGSIHPPEGEGEPRVNLFELHEKITAGLFPAYSNTDERFLALALAGEVGELCNMVKKRWRDSVDLTEEVRDEIADIRVYLELLAKCFGIEGKKLDDQVASKLRRVADKLLARTQNGDGVGK